MAAGAAAAPNPMKTLEKKLEKADGSLKARAQALKSWLEAKFSWCRTRAVVAAKDAKAQATTIAGDKTVQVTAASAAGGAAVVGTGGAATGTFLGALAGGALGLFPALLTFGLSIPVGAAWGGACGLLLGGAAGGAAGGVGAGAAGYAAYTRRVQIAAAVSKARAKIAELFGGTKAKAAQYTSAGRKRAADTYGFAKAHTLAHATSARAKAATAYGVAKDKAEATKDKTVELASDKAVQVAAASAAGGAAVLGTGGAATGLVAGGAIGAAVGLVPAVFTFGLSIPIFAAVGGGCGFAGGAAVGSAAGAIGGGATGYGVYSKRDAIGATFEKGLAKADGCARYVKETASRLAAGGTGGTSD